MVSTTETDEILFFDGYCGLCNRFVDFILRYKKPSSRLKLAPLQGSNAKKYLNYTDITDLSSVIYKKNAKIYRKSSAALHVCGDHIVLLFWVKAFLILPSPIRDLVYDFVATNRYDWFGKKDICRLPTPKEKQHFLE